MQQKDNLKQELDNTAAMLSAGQRENERLRNEAAQVRVDVSVELLSCTIFALHT